MVAVKAISSYYTRACNDRGALQILISNMQVFSNVHFENSILKHLNLSGKNWIVKLQQGKYCILSCKYTSTSIIMHEQMSESL